DPIGLLGGIRPQAYVHNPLTRVDPLGLAESACEQRKRVLENIEASRRARESSNFSDHNEWPPNRGFDGDSSKFTLLPGSTIDRYGTEYGTFASPEGVPYRDRALKPGSDGRPYNVYEVVKPITVDAGDIKGWFGYEGGGTQYELPDKIINLVRDGSLKRR
ncbi:glycohydrolase toxin TNT-related protein, partial [Pectobacterium atrosepticum]